MLGEKKSDIPVIYPELNMSRYECDKAIPSISRCENNYHDLFLGKKGKE